jgi:hypothetical protein
MTNNRIIVITLVILLGLIAIKYRADKYILSALHLQGVSKVIEKNNLIILDSPIPSEAVSSPLHVVGRARGAWYFEGSFPILLLDANGVEIARSTAKAKSDWMSSDFVPFEATLTFDTPPSSTGRLVLKKDNPSGDPARDNSFQIPVEF